MCFTFLKFKAALEAQGISRDSLPHKSFWQPWFTYYALFMCFVMTFVGGYTVFLPGFWTVPDFLFSYTMIFVFPLMFGIWKIVHKTKWVKPAEADLKKDLEEIEEYQRNYVPTPPRYVLAPKPTIRRKFEALWLHLLGAVEFQAFKDHYDKIYVHVLTI